MQQFQSLHRRYGGFITMALSTTLLIAVFATPALHQATVQAQSSNTIFSLRWNSLFPRDTRAVAWGDADGDGDLDLALGNYNAASQIYLNDGLGNLQLASWAPPPANTTSLDWGDLDNDGDLDLVLGNESNQPTQIYWNCLSATAQTPCFEATPLTVATSNVSDISLGDGDGDGDLDLAVADSSAVRVYRNTRCTPGADCSGSRGFQAFAWNPQSTNVTSVAWGDCDGNRTHR
ncbi:MAG: hypothetical protein HC822_12705, partial [Oscillochloris sp.]|nr:hypothetical protein [Oscillochloris sp.]